MNLTNHVLLKFGVLWHLRSLLHEQALTNESLPLGLTQVAAQLGVPREAVQQTIAELVLLGFVKPTADRHLAAANGECRITPEGLAFLNDRETAAWDAALRKAPEPQRSPVGFRLASTDADAL